MVREADEKVKETKEIMSRSHLRDKYMRFQYQDAEDRNPHRKDEAPKNQIPKYIQTHCDASMISWLQEPGTFGGHKVRRQGHRMVSGIIRQKVKEEIRQEIAESL